MRISKTSRLYLILTLLTILSIFGLDYIALKKGKTTFIFSPPQKAALKELQVEPIGDLVLKHLSENQITAEFISQYRDRDGIQHIMVELPQEKYAELDQSLSKKLARYNAQVLKTEKEQDREKKYYQWKVQRNSEMLSVLFSCLTAAPPPEKPVTAQKAKNKVAIIVDDMGFSLEAINELCALNHALTIAVLPYSPLARETANIAHNNQLEVILHLPLEAINNHTDNYNTAGIIHSQMSTAEIDQTLTDNLAEVPYIIGVNTHMGSKITANRQLMNLILAQIKERNLYFVDSRTTARTIAYTAAQEMGIPSAKRNVFLDSEIDETLIKNQLLVLLRLAQKNGKALGICHPSRETLKVLKENIHLIAEYGLEAVSASDIVR